MSDYQNNERIHATNGLFFEVVDGDVRSYQTDTGQPGAHRVYENSMSVAQFRAVAEFVAERADGEEMFFISRPLDLIDPAEVPVDSRLYPVAALGYHPDIEAAAVLEAGKYSVIGLSAESIGDLPAGELVPVYGFYLTMRALTGGVDVPGEVTLQQFQTFTEAAQRELLAEFVLAQDDHAGAVVEALTTNEDGTEMDFGTIDETSSGTPALDDTNVADITEPQGEPDVVATMDSVAGADAGDAAVDGAGVVAEHGTPEDGDASAAETHVAPSRMNSAQLDVAHEALPKNYQAAFSVWESMTVAEKRAFVREALLLVKQDEE